MVQREKSSKLIVEQKDHEKMGHHVRSGGTLVEAWGPLRPIKLFAFKKNTPSQSEARDVGCRELCGCKGGYKDHPVCCFKRVES